MHFEISIFHGTHDACLEKSDIIIALNSFSVKDVFHSDVTLSVLKKFSAITLIVQDE
jgi:hypothetical protein